MSNSTLISVLCLSYILAWSPEAAGQQIKIVGGEDASPGEIKYQVSIRYYNSHHCGGSLAVEQGVQIVLTAAHCVDAGAVSRYSLVAGAIDRRNFSFSGQIRQVKQIISHDDFNGWTMANDIAILEVAEPFDINGTNVAPIKLPVPMQQTSGAVIASGWGSLLADGPKANILQKVQLPVVPDPICDVAYAAKLKVLDSMICAGKYKEGGSDVCTGDGGGPYKAIDGEYLAGIISWGYGCADPNFPGVGTEVSYFIEWIRKKVETMKKRK